MNPICDECKGPLVDDKSGSLVCANCGLVHEAVRFSQPCIPCASRQRLGSLISKCSSPRFPIKGSCDAKYSKYKRLIELQEAIYRGSYLDLFKLTQDLEFVVRYLALPNEVIDRTLKRFGEVTSKVRNPYNSYALLLAICMTIVSREMGERAPAKISEIVTAFDLRGHRFSSKLLTRALFYSSNIIPTSRKFRSCEEFVCKVIAKLKVAPYMSVRLRASNIDIDSYYGQLEVYSKALLAGIPPTKRAGKNPFLLAASAVYVSSSIIAHRQNRPNLFTKTQFSKDAGIAEFTLRSHLSTVFESPAIPVSQSN